MGLIDGIIGLFAGPLQDQVIGNQQADRQKNLMDYQFRNQLDMWERTNYPAQVKMMKRAGLNPALMYGQAGAGGQLGAGLPAGGQGTGGANPFAGADQDIIGLMLAKSQARLNEAKAAEAEANAESKKGIETEVKQFEIQNIIANTHNTEAQTKLTEIQTQINDVNAKIQRATAEEQMNIITTTMLKQSQELEILRNQRYISDQTEQTIIDQTKATLAQTYVETELKRQGITESKARVQQIYEQIKQGWKKLSNEAKELVIKGMQWETNQQDANTREKQLEHIKEIQDVSESTKLSIQTITNVMGIIGKNAAKLK